MTDTTYSIVASLCIALCIALLGFAYNDPKKFNDTFTSTWSRIGDLLICILISIYSTQEILMSRFENASKGVEVEALVPQGFTFFMLCIFIVAIFYLPKSLASYLLSQEVSRKREADRERVIQSIKKKDEDS
jgi:hypothetical protein